MKTFRFTESQSGGAINLETPDLRTCGSLIGCDQCFRMKTLRHAVAKSFVRRAKEADWRLR
jgi:hypothetical protein